MMFLLSLSGSLALICGVVFRKVTERFSSCRWQEMWHWMTLACFLISGFAAMGIKYVMRELRFRGEAEREIRIFISPKSPGILWSHERVGITRAFILYGVVLAVMAVIACCLLVKKIVEYRNVKKMILSGVVYREADISGEEIERMKGVIGLKKDVSVYLTDLPTGAFTIGYLHPVIVLQDEPVREKREVVLLHEMCHIKRRDTLLKFIGMATVCIHWFNPLVYWLPGMINRSCELNCDNMVISHLTPEQRKIYVQEIIEQSKSVPKDRNIFTRFGGNKNLTKDRVINIVQERKKGGRKGVTCLAVILTVMMLVVSSVPAFAYDGVNVLILGDDDAWVERQYEYFSDSEYLFTTGDDLIYEDMNLEVRFARQFTDEDGNVYEVDPDQREDAGCAHSTVIPGTYQSHVKDSTGKCVTESYTAGRCAECGEIFQEKLDFESTYMNCAHLSGE